MVATITIGPGMGAMAVIMGDITVNTIKDTTVGIIENIMVDTVVDIGDSWIKDPVRLRRGSSFGMSAPRVFSTGKSTCKYIIFLKNILESPYFPYWAFLIGFLNVI